MLGSLTEHIKRPWKCWTCLAHSWIILDDLGLSWNSLDDDWTCLDHCGLAWITIGSPWMIFESPGAALHHLWTYIYQYYITLDHPGSFSVMLDLLGSALADSGSYWILIRLPSTILCHLVLTWKILDHVWTCLNYFWIIMD